MKNKTAILFYILARRKMPLFKQSASRIRKIAKYGEDEYEGENRNMKKYTHTLRNITTTIIATQKIDNLNCQF